ncbi:P-loop containing nucleoside triphosphatehydrolases superfamily protein [Striga asiatica]|uniref:P-loop containing nucleoside triphosphatehydrolases superfamily protein n=1 Tax=Striga asiatica TaxID=4170 RepID=A0A5A7QYT2_STRAF|nr:P-loop containing nucleoside triphosphatehydrolases superfamily protein [Striga asiatica]
MYGKLKLLARRLVFTGDARGAVDEDEDHAPEGPGDAEEADAATLVGVAELEVADDGGDGDVEEEERGDELGDDGAVEGPEHQLAGSEEWRRRGVDVVLAALVYGLLAHFLRHACVYCPK